jgi:hypothetical protein
MNLANLIDRNAAFTPDKPTTTAPLTIPDFGDVHAIERAGTTSRSEHSPRSTC